MHVYCSLAYFLMRNFSRKTTTFIHQAYLLLSLIIVVHFIEMTTVACKAHFTCSHNVFKTFSHVRETMGCNSTKMTNTNLNLVNAIERLNELRWRMTREFISYINIFPRNEHQIPVVEDSMNIRFNCEL